MDWIITVDKPHIMLSKARGMQKELPYKEYIYI